MKTKSKNKLTTPQTQSLLSTLETRFHQHPTRHPQCTWPDVAKQLSTQPDKLWALHQMELTDGEPDVVQLNPKQKQITFIDCSRETPAGRTSVCYDREGWESRKEHRPKTNAMDLAAEMGVEILNEEDYLALQKLGEFDTKTSSWILTPPEMRTLGGALYGDRRYNRIFIGHNGAQSYYSARAFRAKLTL